MNLDTRRPDHPLLIRRFLRFSLVAAAVFLLLLLRLWYLQIIAHERYLHLSEKNRIRHVPVAAPRGPIFDRAGRLLVDNRPAFIVSALRHEITDPDQVLARLPRFLGTDPEPLKKRWRNRHKLRSFRPVPLATDVSREAMERVQENSLQLPGILVEVRPARAYPAGEVGAHLFGYLGEITLDELRSSRFADYRGGELVGKTGLERKLEPYLRGSEGERRVEVDVAGKELRQLQTEEAIPGKKVYLTLRRDLMETADRAFGEQAGAAVVMDVRSGEILAMISKPGFDPALFARGITGEEWLALLENPRNPLENKAIKGQYPPGSTFKPVVALAALRAGAATAETTYDCSGEFELGDRVFRCWKEEGHGRTDLRKALKESCDIWFYQVGLETGIDSIAAAARELGLGAALGFPLEGEKKGLVPDRQWKRQRFGEPWYRGETAIAAIGQGFVLATPLQLAAMTAALATGEQVPKPVLLRRIEDWDGTTLVTGGAEPLDRPGFAPEHLELVREALEAVVNEIGGTAYLSRLESVRIAGKTGTAQVVRLRHEEGEEKPELEEIPYKERDHALFIAYAPAASPEVAVSVVVEHGGHGSSAAAPIAKTILSRYFNLERPAADAGEKD